MTSPPGSGLAPTSPSPHERATLSRELSEFLIELSIALHKHAMYPEDHPSLGPAARGVLRRAEALLQDRASLSLGVARNQLVIEGVATDPRHPVLAELAGRLHRHHLGAVTFSRGVETGEILSMLRTLAVEADRTGQPLGLGDPEKLSAWQHVRLHSMTYERLELLDEKSNQPPDVAAEGRSLAEEAELRDARVRGAQLWIGLARAALAGQIKDEEPPPTKPAVIAKAIDDHPRGEAYDQVIVGYLLQIAEELKAAGGAEAVELRRRTSRLIGEMKPETLRRLIEMGGDGAQRRKFVVDASMGMAVDAVLEIVKAAAEASQHSVSGSLMRMLSKLAAHAEQGKPQARTLADSALRDQVKGLLTGWDLDDPNPESYGKALQRMSQSSTAVVDTAERSFQPEVERLVQMSLEADAVGPGVYRACNVMLERGRLAQLIDLLESAPEGTAVVQNLWGRAVSQETLQWLLASEPVDFATVDRVLPRLGVLAADPLLDALASAEARATRRALLERIKRLGPMLGPSITARLSDERWYVQRNLLTVLDELPQLPEGFSVLPWLSHTDPRVRLEALKIGVKAPEERPRVLAQALADREHRVVRLALNAAHHDLPATVLPRIIALADSRQTAPDLRVQAIRVLGAARAPEALDELVRLVDGGRTLLGRRRLLPRSRELVAALAALATGWRDEPRALELLALAAVSNDADVRAATDPEPAAS
ncbi:MAG TPA: hypothetical protein VKB45_12415 [Gemmatimonadales bacterium]|nr:hypothetical protein [Gemmatimonadales bacterium]